MPEDAPVTSATGRVAVIVDSLILYITFIRPYGRGVSADKRLEEIKLWPYSQCCPEVADQRPAGRVKECAQCGTGKNASRRRGGGSSRPPGAGSRPTASTARGSPR